MSPAPTPEAASPRTPALSLIFGYGPALVLPIAALAAWTRVPLALLIGQIWGAAILVFLAGVVRGLSFFTPGGPHLSQMLTMILRFSLGLVALIAGPPTGFALLILGYASIALTDPWIARWGGAPLHFARLRPPQMMVALIGLIAMFLLSLG
ncbi:DUF3429 domain-containing protein [Sphingomonas sp. SORGH_AS_0879]|uniref:DUF3429 domain-containing protein n=1 Tax=Sphingomonas sp. SORGH_AS_0879 TaxID=3041790 RepID=UPI00277DFE83|nr:DUF3429 domain-containing protein [Sphingomonas sp. SORGH_AS_0879]MDQ1229430.1 hypothetical protein [Sphingomonas sp. SORGH_AS_0879]